MDNFTRLEDFYKTMDALSPSSEPERYDAFAAFFSDDCTAYLKSMREYDEPSNGRKAVVDSLKEILKEYHVHERRILSHSTSSDGRTVFCEMNNVMHVLGQALDPFYETAVAAFNEQGLIIEYKQYSCRSHIVEIVQDKTGLGPYGKLEGTRGVPLARASCCSREICFTDGRRNSATCGGTDVTTECLYTSVIHFHIIGSQT
ncbi:hypothetical protein F5884DRAFT_829802 [Xylogone sp. PMI_703]|nr:hypothetical protein F5884DRAFT_829802 [Xylogone sp. PMI_703]